MTPPTESSWVIDLADLAATERLARELSEQLRPGDLVTLTGDLGSGKTTFARALIRTLKNDPDLEIVSPTFTLMQIYDQGAFPIVHCDLYRISKLSELDELGWSEVGDSALVLVEWADRAGDTLQADRLDVGMILEADGSPEHRVAVITGYGAWAQRVAMMKATDQMLRLAGWRDARRTFMLGDASTRAYERLQRDDETAVLMISPPRPDGPPVRYGRPYSAIARLAEDVKPFVALAQGLSERGFSAPKILAQDLKAGLLLTEDLGHETVLIDGKPDAERYMLAAALLAALHALDLPDRLPVTAEIEHRIPPFDLDALLIEVELMLDWYLPYRGKSGLSASARGHFTNGWKAALAETMAGPKTWVLRDYHSPNLMWLPEREGIARIGLIDFQDAVIGHPAYDVASLAQDARVDVDQALELKLLSVYARGRRDSDPAFDMSIFARDYAVMGAQRATKILGIFARLKQRDGKDGYIRHLPRIEANVAKCLAHPALAVLRQWYADHVPGLAEKLAPADGG